MQRIGGARRKSRHKMRKSIGERGKFYIQNFLQTFQIGEQVLLKAYPSYQKGIFCLRFHGKIGKVLKPQGGCFRVEIKDGGKTKTCVVHPVHLNKI